MVLEYHAQDVDWWDKLVKERPVIRDGYVELTDKPDNPLTIPKVLTLCSARLL